jgi:uncharacterized protein YndB with AHSA1/START domain
MTSTLIPAVVSADAPFVIERTFAAPIERVWRAFTEADQLNQWMSPPGMLPAGCTMDLRQGGLYHYGMKAPDGSVWWGKQIYLAVEPPHSGVARLVAIVGFSDAHQGVTRHPLATSTFTAVGDSTRLRLQWQACNATGEEQATFNAGHASMTQGWSGTMAQLDAWLAGQTV